jgi:hypothetical protein
MPASFYIYSLDANPVTSPLTATTHVKLDDPPYVGDYDTEGDGDDRGSVHQTLGGIVVQDFGVMECDRRIRIAGEDVLTSSTKSALETLYVAVNTEYYFGDGYEVWKVQFSRSPKGLKTWRNLKYSHVGHPYWTYEINLIVKDKVV